MEIVKIVEEVKMETLNECQKLFCPEHGPQKIKAIEFKSAVDSMDDCVIMTNVIGDIKYVNPTFEKKYGYLPDEIIGKHISIISHAQSQLAIDKESFLQDTKNDWGGNLISVNKHGLTLKMNIKCSPIIKDKRRINLVFVMRQI